MKADAMGTLSEQLRAQHGWRTAGEIKAQGLWPDQVCKTCYYGEEKTPGNWHCGEMRIATRANATCRQWEARP